MIKKRPKIETKDRGDLISLFLQNGFKHNAKGKQEILFTEHMWSSTRTARLRDGARFNRDD